ncbi:Undecaprenyl-phosphate 4-deoxy-4-formamido-L-arabinose transferase [Pirellulimonas nuda]|uniref:Undecaprenyl-phosphate 4-deoxy-4-formamido-L-arabinose transferase n=1 Tax=Pirellulimonas nuda TaxID=2528009 RepID=A0A518DIR7_9BACT|nr:glycosyltransferase family 2 protein [Pirellulimonas nuda]QDU91368.1 Undecaprenyl-phosphate 4-deoxy-4-formamido-L-arabinose transferase [Pirellulimonas nuda]
MAVKQDLEPNEAAQGDSIVAVKPQAPQLPALRPERDTQRMLGRLAEAEAALAEAIAEEHADEVARAVKLTVLMPVYNERTTIREIVRRVLEGGLCDELVIVDDCSTDGTRDILIELDRLPQVRVFLHGYNRGKGAALRTAMVHARGEVVLIQDADLEYDPADYARLVEPIERGDADVVFGSRFLDAENHNSTPLHLLGNRLLTWASNVTTGLKLTDMETCYKVFRRGATRGMNLREDRFGFEPELTAKLARRGCRVVEVPVSYNGRTWSDGKKIGMRDALRALWCIVRYAWVD